MSLAAKALFVIERNLHQELTLEAVASACGVSRFHLAHAFAAAAHRGVMDYARARRLSEAARALASGAPSVLELALSAGYQSHEAFSRAFRAQFHLTPERLRERGVLDGVALTEVLHMTDRQPARLAPPRVESAGEFLFVGLGIRRRLGEAALIPAQWREFMSGAYRDIAHRLDEAPVGVTVPTDSDDEFLYVCAAAVARVARPPTGLETLRVPAARYAVFLHDGHVSELPQVYEAIWNDWFAASGETPRRAPSLERHLSSFDPRTGSGGVAVWIPLTGS